MNKVCEEFDTFIKDTLEPIQDASISSVKEVVDEEAQKLYEEIKSSTPVRTGKLAQSLTIKRKNSSANRYGYIVDYEGYNELGVPFSKIARTLNKGTKAISATRHIDRAIRNLKGLDERIYQRFLEKIKRR